MVTMREGITSLQCSYYSIPSVCVLSDAEIEAQSLSMEDAVLTVHLLAVGRLHAVRSILSMRTHKLHLALET
jgi:hypothetical protein